MTLSQGQGTLTVSYELIGLSGTGAFIQNGGTHYAADQYIGRNGGSGSYNLIAGHLDSMISRHIGDSGTGVFTQNGGTNYTGAQYISRNGGSGSYNLSGGQLNVGYEQIGGFFSDVGSNGTFIQSGGTHRVDGQLILFGAGNSYNLNAGDLATVSWDYIGGGGAFTQNGGMHYSAYHFQIDNGTYALNSGSMSAAYESIGVWDVGVFTQSGGTHTVGGTLALGGYAFSDVGVGAGSGAYILSGGTLSANSEDIGIGGTGTFNQSGGTHTVTGTMTLAANPGSSGTYNFTGGTLTAGTIVNNGAFNQSGATTVAANITNNGTYNASGPGANTVAGDFTNNTSGTIKTTDTTLTFTGTFTNFGAYISDPSDNHFTDLIVGATGYLVGGTGDNFFVGNNFTNNSTNALWNTQNARLVFDTGADSLHDFTLGGLAASEAFSWGMIELAAGNTLNLFGMSFYVDTLILGSGAGFNLDGATIYYRHLVNNGGSIAYSNGGQMLAWGGGPSVTPVPEPETWAMLLAGLGLLGFTAQRRKRNAAWAYCTLAGWGS